MLACLLAAYTHALAACPALEMGELDVLNIDSVTFSRGKRQGSNFIYLFLFHLMTKGRSH